MAHPRRTGRQLTLPRRRSGGISTQRLDKLIAEATVDGHDDAEQITGFQAMLEEHLDLPFKTKIFGLDVTVEAIQLTEAAEMVAMCTRGSIRQAIPLLRLPLPKPRPRGAEWIEAYRRWGRAR